MKTLILLGILAGAMSAQDFHGVSVIAGPGNIPVLVNHSDKALLGFAIQEGEKTNSILDLNSVAYGKLVAAGESRPIPGIGIFGGSVSDTVIAVLFDNGQFFGPEQVFLDFEHRVESIRSMARDVQYSEDRFNALASHAANTVDNAAARRQRGERIDFKAVQHRSILAQRLMDRRNYDGDEAVSATIDRIAALPDAVKGEQQ